MSREDHVLAWDLDHLDPQIDADHLLDERDQQDEAGSLHVTEAAEREDDRALILPQDLYRRPDEVQPDEEQQGDKEKRG